MRLTSKLEFQQDPTTQMYNIYFYQSITVLEYTEHDILQIKASKCFSFENFINSTDDLSLMIFLIENVDF